MALKIQAFVFWNIFLDLKRYRYSHESDRSLSNKPHNFYWMRSRHSQWTNEENSKKRWVVMNKNPGAIANKSAAANFITFLYI